jgi:hypothetical protein
MTVKPGTRTRRNLVTLNITAVAVVLGGSVLVVVDPAQATTPGFGVHANGLCSTVLDKIQDPPGEVRTMRQLTRPVGDRWLGSAADAFATLAARLTRLDPPPETRAEYRAMIGRFSTLARVFRIAKRHFDRGDSKSFLHEMSVATVVGGRAAAAATTLHLPACGP